jgi:hypothetical protein
MSEQGSIITIHTYSDVAAATVALNLIKEKGIEGFIENENVVGLNPLGGVELKVFAKDIVAAEAALSS